MGLDAQGARFVLYARSLGVSFQSTAMIGRQSLHLSTRELHRLLRAYGYPYSHDQVHGLYGRNQGYAEPFLEALGAETVASLDASAYEQASDVVDLNYPLPERFNGRFTAVLDGGSLEHIFNFPVAIRCCMEMLAVGGHFLGIVPANNFLGHGFYQFSPELFFRVFSPANGFEVTKMVLFEESLRPQWYEVVDPERSKGRVELINRRPTYLAVIARKLRATEPFTSAVYQSDYVSVWNRSSADRSGSLLRIGRRLMGLVPTRLRIWYGWLTRGGTWSFYRPKLYKRIDAP